MTDYRNDKILNIVEPSDSFFDPPEDDDDDMTDEQREAMEEQDRLDYADRDFSNWQDCR